MKKELFNSISIKLNKNFTQYETCNKNLFDIVITTGIKKMNSNNDINKSIENNQDVMERVYLMKYNLYAYKKSYSKFKYNGFVK